MVRELAGAATGAVAAVVLIIKASGPLWVPIPLLCALAVVAVGAVRKFLDERRAYADALEATDPHLEAALEDVDRLIALQAQSQARIDVEVVDQLADEAIRARIAEESAEPEEPDPDPAKHHERSKR
jgi:hypothetical protein